MRWSARLLVLLGLVLLAPALASGQSSLGVSWDAPTTNADGTPLRDLAGYRLYLGTTCPGPSFATIPSPTTSPAPGTRVAWTVTGLKPSTTYTARITAVDVNGNESSCTAPITGVSTPATPLLQASNLRVTLGPDPPPATFTALPSLVTFTWRAGGPLPAAQVVTISGGSGAWTTQDANPWADVLGGSYNPATMLVTFPATATAFSVAPGPGMRALAPGVYDQTITVRRGTLSAVVTVRVTAQPPQNPL